MKRINSRLDSAIPISQAAYRKSKSTTEHVFATKAIIVTIISSTDENVYLLLLNMGKALDSTRKNILVEDLKKALNQDELHLIRIMLDVKIVAKYGNRKSRFFSAETGDCASATELSLYPVKSLETTIANETLSLEEHNTMQSNYTIVPQTYQIDIDQ